MSVDDFLKHVHPELPDASIKPIYDLNDHPDKYDEYYSELKELEELKNSILTNRIKRNYKNLRSDVALLPTGNLSENWYLVTNNPIENLKKDEDSFIYGKDPNREDATVPIYAVVTLCEGEEKLEKHVKRRKGFEKEIKATKNRYIPVSLPRSLDISKPVQIVMAETVIPVNITNVVNDTTPEETNKTEKWMDEETKSDWKPTVINLTSKQTTSNPPITSFFVDYWMFYPYSAGKIMCSLDLGPLGPIPIPLVFGFCLGTKKEFGYDPF